MSDWVVVVTVVLGGLFGLCFILYLDEKVHDLRNRTDFIKKCVREVLLEGESDVCTDEILMPRKVRSINLSGACDGEKVFLKSEEVTQAPEVHNSCPLSQWVDKEEEPTEEETDAWLFDKTIVCGDTVIREPKGKKDVH